MAKDLNAKRFVESDIEAFEFLDPEDETEEQQESDTEEDDE